MNTFDQLQVALIISGRNLPREAMIIIADYCRYKIYIVCSFTYWQDYGDSMILYRIYAKNPIHACAQIVKNYPERILHILGDYEDKPYKKIIHDKYKDIFGVSYMGDINALMPGVGWYVSLPMKIKYIVDNYLKFGELIYCIMDNSELDQIKELDEIEL